MKSVAFVGGTAVLPDGLLPNAVILCEQGKITSVSDQRSGVPSDVALIDAKGGYLCPGFIDIHVHGGGGADVMDGTPDAVRVVAQSHARHGTTRLFPTTTTATIAQLSQMLQACRDVQEHWTIADGSRVEGVHLYGPYFAPEKAGCHDPDHCRTPEATEFDQYFETGMVKIATCAAELPGAARFYEVASRHRCLVTCGHSNASWSEMARAFEHGMRHVDHFWCAMSNVSSVRNRLGTPMQGSMLEYVLANAEMSTEVIADGMHLSPELLWFAWKMKSVQRLCLVTDCNRAMDMPPGEYRFGPETDGAWFASDGKVGRVAGGSLASAVTGMDHMVRTMHGSANVPLVDVIRMATLTPAERVGIDETTGSLEPGKDADVLVLDPELQIQQVHIAGVRYC